MNTEINFTEMIIIVMGFTKDLNITNIQVYYSMMKKYLMKI